MPAAEDTRISAKATESCSQASKAIVGIEKEAGDVQVSMKLIQMKELSTHWLEDVFEFIQKNKDIITNGLKKAGILEAIANTPVPDSDIVQCIVIEFYHTCIGWLL